MQELFANHEIVTYRERPYECAALAAELARRFVAERGGLQPVATA